MTPTSTDLKRKTGDGKKSAAAGPLQAEELQKMDAYWRALNYLSVGQIYLLDNPLLREPLKREHIKPRLLGHWGTSPGLNMLCVHLNRVIKKDDLSTSFTSSARGTAARRWWPTPTWKGPTARSTRTSPRTPRG